MRSFPFVASYAAAPKKCTSLPEQSVTLVPSTPRAWNHSSPELNVKVIFYPHHLAAFLLYVIADREK